MGIKRSSDQRWAGWGRVSALEGGRDCPRGVQPSCGGWLILRERGDDDEDVAPRRRNWSAAPGFEEGCYSQEGGSGRQQPIAALSWVMRKETVVRHSIRRWIQEDQIAERPLRTRAEVVVGRRLDKGRLCIREEDPAGSYHWLKLSRSACNAEWLFD